MKAAILLLSILSIRAADAISGDINLDGKVDFTDFFLLADNFGRTGPPEGSRVTVYDTVTVAFVEPPDSVVTTGADMVIRDFAGNELSYLSFYPYGRGVLITTYYRKPIDSDDKPWIVVEYDKIRIALSLKVRYVPISIDTSLVSVPGDTSLVLRDVFFPQGFNSWLDVSLQERTDDRRYPEIANTRGDVIADIVYRTPLQGDYAVRAIIPVRVSENGKILYF